MAPTASDLLTTPELVSVTAAAKRWRNKYWLETPIPAGGDFVPYEAGVIWGKGLFTTKEDAERAAGPHVLKDVWIRGNEIYGCEYLGAFPVEDSDV